MCSTIIECLFAFQTLIAGLLAVIAAVGTAIVIWWSARLPVKHELKIQKEKDTRRVSVGSLALSSDFQILRSRASQAMGTIHVHIAGNHDVTDANRWRVLLPIPQLISDWEYMALLPADLAKSVLSLGRTLEHHNFDMERSAGAFGADNFRDHILKRLDRIMVEATKLRQDLSKLAAGS